MYLLDTNTVIALLTSVLARASRRFAPINFALSAIVVDEPLFGAFKSARQTDNLATVDALMFQVLPFDADDARQAGDIRAFLATKGTPLGPYDILIAGRRVRATCA